ncbi:hypothetical protein QR98_0088420 [Sarcoptes scabiei]|uniref:Uncharacterized protein n=1 Tax=Sarcoptes scabiei TaxID=52283 RepID=A0A132AIL3_SARSC|nr:hypothetical protein QR98_0088420 [Sarcoptes scabiei]
MIKTLTVVTLIIFCFFQLQILLNIASFDPLFNYFDLIDRSSIKIRILSRGSLEATLNRSNLPTTNGIVE